MATLTRGDWIHAATSRLASDGVEAVRIEPLAAQLGVSKGSFYWHFDDRAALLRAVLERWRERGTRGVIALTEASAKDPRERLTALLREVFSHPEEDGFEVAVRAWAAINTAAREAVLAVDEERVAYVTSLLIDAGVSRPDAATSAAVAYRALLGEFLLRNYGTGPLTADGIGAIVTLALRDTQGDEQHRPRE